VQQIDRKTKRSTVSSKSGRYNVNNFYGSTMCQSLPYVDFWWVNNVENFDVMNVTLDHRQITFSKLTWSIRNISMICTPIYRFVRRVRNFLISEMANASQIYMIKSNIYYRNLQQCIRHGLRITQIYCITVRAIFMASQVHRTQYKF